VLFCVEINSARSLACEDKTDKYEVCCHNFIFTFCLIVRHNRNMLPFLLYIFPVNHSRPALMGCSMTTSKLGGGSHVNDWLPSTPPSLHTKHLVFSCSMLLSIISQVGLPMFGDHLPHRHTAVHLAPCRKEGCTVMSVSCL